MLYYFVCKMVVCYFVLNMILTSDLRMVTSHGHTPVTGIRPLPLGCHGQDSVEEGRAERKDENVGLSRFSAGNEFQSTTVLGMKEYLKASILEDKGMKVLVVE